MNAEKVEALAAILARDGRVGAVGLSSDPVPERGDEGDIDLFVYCSMIPPPARRGSLYEDLGFDAGTLELRRFVSGNWGDADYFELGGVETWVMYFTERAARAEFDAISSGRRHAPENGFYPTGRLAMYRGMRILAEREGFLSALKRELADYPPRLRMAELRGAMADLDDDEDLSRAALRADPLFYHAALEEAVDRLLRLVYALNEVLFPSRKRVRAITAGFQRSPGDFDEKLCEIVRLGGSAETLDESFNRYRRLRDEVKILCRDPRVLDPGCGTGELTRKRAACADRVVGVDLSPKMLRRAAELNAEDDVEYRAQPAEPRDGVAPAGSGLRLRPWSPEDAAGLAAIGDDPEIAANMNDGFPSPFTLERAKDYIARALAGANLLLAVEAEGRLVGSVGAFFSAERPEEAAIAYFIGRAYWNKGYGGAAVGLLVGLLRSRGVRLVAAEPFDRNGASKRLLEKSGFRSVGRLEGAGTKEGRPIDLRRFGLELD